MIAVPSKQRLRSATIRSLIKEGLDPIVWVHNSEASDYQYAYPGISLMTHWLDNIGAIRAAMLDFARMQGEPVLWQIDDDIKLRMRPEGSTKHYPVSWRVGLCQMEAELIHWPTVALAGPVPTQYAFRLDKPVLNGFYGGIVLIRTDGPWRYSEDVAEDWDIVAQVWNAGRHTVRWPQWSFDTPLLGTSRGGMEEAYATGWQAPRRAATLARWPQYVKPGGRFEMRFDRSALSVPERVLTP